MPNSEYTTASFLNYAPFPLAFGTSGLRGLVKDITDLEAYINVKAALRYLASNADIAHIRPSGNAPQLRIYANSDSQARADQIVELALREPGGILPQLERALT